MQKDIKIIKTKDGRFLINIPKVIIQENHLEEEEKLKISNSGNKIIIKKIRSLKR